MLAPRPMKKFTQFWFTGLLLSHNRCVWPNNDYCATPQHSMSKSGGCQLYSREFEGHTGCSLKDHGMRFRNSRSVGACTRRVFPPCGSLKSSGVQSVCNALGRESDGGIVSSNNHCQLLFLIAHAGSFSLLMPRMKVRPGRNRCYVPRFPIH